jgi:polar amino acid transport system substrate-binding protein
MLFTPKLTIYTEEFPPYNYTEGGKIMGVSTEIVEKVMKNAGIDYEIKSLSWDRTYQLAQETPNALIYSISRRKKREELFKWIAVIAPSKYSVFALRSRTDIYINRLEDLKSYRIGTSIDDARETYLLDNGFELSDFKRISGKDVQLRNIQRLLNNMVDVIPMSDAVAFYTAKKAGYDSQKLLRKVFPLPGLSGGFYLAASHQTSDAVVDKIRQEIVRLKQSGEYMEIRNRWGL